MPRRVSLPGASELFRSTGADPVELGRTVESTEGQWQELRLADPPGPVTSGVAETDGRTRDELAPAPARSRPGGRAERGSGRVRHEEKITVYVSSDELIALEEARLRLRAEHGLAVDRGRIVRQAISAAMADFAAHGADSELVSKLSTS